MMMMMVVVCVCVCAVSALQHPTDTAAIAVANGLLVKFVADRNLITINTCSAVAVDIMAHNMNV